MKKSKNIKCPCCLTLRHKTEVKKALDILISYEKAVYNNYKLFEINSFESLKQELIRDLRNSKKQTPYRQLFKQFSLVLFDPFWSDQELADTLEKFVPSNLNTLLLATNKLFWSSNVIAQIGSNMGLTF